jgi:hypothetical protein
MPLDNEFRHHLHELMIETRDKLRDQLNEHERQLIWTARQTHNAAAIPGAHSKASIDAFRTRVSATIASYLAALETFGITVDNSVENEMLGIIRQLTSAVPSLSLPPAVKPANIASIQRAHKMESARVGNSLYREGANRLREIKIKARQTPPAINGPITMTRTEPFTIASVARTLAGLKALPISDQARLLLKRLIYIEPQVRSSGGFNKHNLLLPGDPWGLATGFPDSENEGVRLHLLGSPWTRLVNDGLLIDPRGSGFFLVSEEGLAANANVIKPAPASGQNEINNEADGTPTAFISYSWDSDDHKLWVRQLAEKLRSQGVRVILDQWHLNIGGDRTRFMESSITASDFVVVICTPAYAAKGNNRDGGVGYEAMIITSQLARNILQDKFIPVLRSGDWDDSAVPIWLQSKIGVDLRGDPYDRKQYDILIRGLHKAHESAPPVGPKPVFAVNEADIVDNAVSAILEQEGEPTTSSLAIATNRSSDEPPRSPIAYAWYELKGTAERIQAYVRPTADQLFRFDTSSGEILRGTELAVAQRYLGFDLELRQKGYARTQTFNGSGGQSFNLP